MVLKKNATASRKRFTFSSFKDRIESIKIGPNLQLAKKSFHEAEISHFLSTYEHWKEVNLSKSFTEFGEIIEPLCLSLPQLIHHQSEIFDALESTILQNDKLSLEPSLELLSQFAHDLGPDFMAFYSRALAILVKLALKQTESDPLEWIFNTLAYLFKYLSRELSKDLIPTFELLLPLLTIQKKEYIAKFASQAISFLIRKSSTDSLTKFVEEVFNKEQLQGESINSYHYSLTISFSDAFKNSSNTLHSKTSSILRIVSEQCLLNPKSSSVLSDIIISTLNHAETTESSKILYDAVFSSIDDKLSLDLNLIDLTSIVNVLITLVFSDSGRKISNWNKVYELTNTIIAKADEALLTEDMIDSLDVLNFGDSYSQFCSILFRNGDPSDLSKNHITILNSLIDFNNGSFFLQFIDNATDLNKEKIVPLAKKYVTDFITKYWETDYLKIALFLTKMKSKDLINTRDDNSSSFKIVIPLEFSEFIITKFTDLVKQSEELDSESLLDIYWRLLVLKYTSVSVDHKALIELLTSLTSTTSSTSQLFAIDVAGNILGAISNQQDLTDDECTKVLQLCFNKLQQDEWLNSHTFIEGCLSLLNSIKSTHSSSKSLISDLKEEVSFKLSENLVTPSHKIREKSLSLIIAMYQVADEEVSDLVHQSRLIEQTPLEITLARDIQARFRKLGTDFANDGKTDKLTNNIIAKFVFGQLNNKFMPSWEGIFEMIPSVINKISDITWDLAYKMISMKYASLQESSNSKNYYESDFADFESVSDRSSWVPQDQRLVTNYELSTRNFHLYESIKESLIEVSLSNRESLVPTSFLRGQTIKLLMKVPQVAEKNFQYLLPYIINDDVDLQADEEEEGDGEDTKNILQDWTLFDRNLLIELLTKFKKLNKVYGASELKEFLFTLLSNKFVKTQRLALDCLLNWKEPVYNKYSDNLKNLLDDTLFRDETIKLLQNNEDNQIEVKDIDTLIPIVIRILFGRAQTSRTSGTKQSRRMAAINILTNLKDIHIEEFLRLSFHKIDYQNFIETGELSIGTNTCSYKSLRTMSGFLNLNLEVVSTLGKNHFDCNTVLVEPLIYTLALSEYVIANENKFVANDESIVVKIARNNRSLGFKLLLDITEYLGQLFNWEKYGDLIFDNLVRSKLPKFSTENLQQPSSLMKLMTTLWCEPNLQFFLYYDNYAPVKSLLDILPNPNAKDSVLLAVLEFILLLLQNSSIEDENFINVMALVISESLNSLVLIFDHTSNKFVNAKTVEVLLTLVEREFITDNDHIQVLIDSLTSALGKPNNQIELRVKADIVRILSALVKEYDCSVSEIIPLYKNISRLYQFYPERDMRFNISLVFQSMKDRFNELEDGCQYAIDLNSYSPKRIKEPDFETRLNCFSMINQNKYNDLTFLDWLPVVYTSLFFINDTEELSLRSSSGYTLIRFIDCLTNEGFDEKHNGEEERTEFIKFLKDEILPAVRSGLRKTNEFVQTEYINVLCHVVEKSEEADCSDMSDLKVLLYNGDEEADFFKNVNHPQVHRRQRAVRRLVEFGSAISSFNISHYLIPMIEHYAFHNEDESLRNTGNETVNTIAQLMLNLSWNQFRGIYSRYISIMVNLKKNERSKPEELRDAIHLIVAVTASLNKVCNMETKPKDFFNSSEKVDSYIIQQVMPPMKKLLTIRDEDTVIARAPLSEALVSLAMCCSEENINNELPGILTSVCHILRSKSEELRDMIRKQLGKITISLGPDYFKFILKELKGSLARGSQLHILSFTVHYLLVVLDTNSEEGGLKHGQLSDCNELIMEVIMNDIFGVTSQEKEADGYNNKMKEIKHNKSFDTGELIAKNIELKDFGVLLTPIRYILQEKLSIKNQHKLDELLRRFSLGLNNNEESSSTDILLLSHQIFQSSKEILGEKEKKSKRELTEQEERFMTQLDVKAMVKTQVEYGLYIKTMQKFSFELLRTAITRHESLYNIENLSPFVGVLTQALEDNDDEGVMISALRVLSMLVRLRFPDEVDSQFTRVTRMVLKVIKDSPSTNNELCQSCFRFLANVIRHKEDLRLKDTAMSYILKRIEPDLDEPLRQGVAFNLLKALLQKHVMLPELYDTMDKVSKIMITSTSNEIREVSRSSFFIFLMEYDQSKGRLEKQFKMLINNLSYPAQDGRKSVMELIHLIVMKSSKELLDKLAASFFIALCNVYTMDTASSCREMASLIISKILSKMVKLGCDLTGSIDKYITTWISQNKNELLVRCGLNVYKLYVESVGLSNSRMNEVAVTRITTVLNQAKRNEEEDEEDEDDSNASSNWELVYSSLNIINKIQEVDPTLIYDDKKYRKSIWLNVIDCLLYPHSWVRLSSTRILNELLSYRGDSKIQFESYELQTIAYRLFRQFGAPNIMENLSIMSSRCLVYISKTWYEEQTKFISTGEREQLERGSDDDDDDVEENEEENRGHLKHGNKKKFDLAIDWAMNKADSTLKNESRPLNELIVTKRSMIQYLYIMISSVLSTESILKYVSGDKGLLLTLINLSESTIESENNNNNGRNSNNNNNKGKNGDAGEVNEDANSLSLSIDKLMKLISDKLGNSEYNIQYAKAKQIITRRRQDRKTRRSQLSLTNPAVSAMKKMKKHQRFREKRKLNKDENGLYRDKSKKRRL